MAGVLQFLTPMLDLIDVGSRTLASYQHVAPDHLLEELRHAAAPLRGARVLHVNATPYGGGVSELLRSVVPLLDDLGLVAHWRIIRGEDRFFDVTKAMHNGLQGAARGRYARAREHHEATGHCLYCDLVEAELETRVRVVLATELFAVYCPFASGVPYETWIAPRRHQPSFGTTSRQERVDLAQVLRRTLGALDRALDHPDFNYVLHTAPIADEARSYYLWHLQILPRIATLAGFELGWIPINSVTPEEAAGQLRPALPGEPIGQSAPLTEAT